MALSGNIRMTTSITFISCLTQIVLSVPMPNSDTVTDLGGGLVLLGGGTFGGVERVDNGGGVGSGAPTSVNAQIGGGVTEKQQQPQTCKNWCITSQKKLYCCPKKQKKFTQPKASPACPPLRTTCPTTLLYSQCSQDSNCSTGQKCCYDNCVQKFACKDPITNVG